MPGEPKTKREPLPARQYPAAIWGVGIRENVLKPLTLKDSERMPAKLVMVSPPLSEEFRFMMTKDLKGLLRAFNGHAVRSDDKGRVMTHLEDREFFDAIRLGEYKSVTVLPLSSRGADLPGAS